MLPSFFCDLSPENFLWRRIFFLLSRKFFLLRKTFFFLRRKNLRCFPKIHVKLPKNFLTEVKVLNFFTFWAMLRDVKKVDKAILSTFSRQVDEVRVDKMVWLERLLARCIALITLKPQNLITLIERLLARCIALKPYNLTTLYTAVVLCTLCSVL